MNDLKSESRIEEIIAALWSIAALLALIAHMPWLAVILAIKAFADILCAIGYAVCEIKLRNLEK